MMMEMEVEVPECPVCLQSFDHHTIVPRVLGCGHSACEDCLKQLPQPFPHTLRCPACTQLLKLPPQGPSALPRNIDLLRFAQPTPRPDHPPRQQPQNPTLFMPRLWSDDFNSAWKDWVLPDNSVLFDPHQGLSSGLMKVNSAPMAGFQVKEENCKVSLVRVGLGSSEKDTLFTFTYFVKVMIALKDMDHGVRDELRLILQACSRRSCVVSEVYGFWHSVEDGSMYLVFEQKCANFMERIEQMSYNSARTNFCFGAMGMEFCEAIITLHSRGLVLGCSGLECLDLDEFGHLRVDLSGVLLTARGGSRIVAKAVAGKKKINESKMVQIYSRLFEQGILISPEVFLGFLRHQGIIMECDNSRFSVGCASDVWSLACLLISIILGKNMMENVIKCLNSSQPEVDLDFLGWYTGWLEKVKSLLRNTMGNEHVLCQILCKCIDMDPNSRPLASGVWRSFRYFLSKVQPDDNGDLKESRGEEHLCCIALGKLCQLPKETDNSQEDTNSVGIDDDTFVKHASEISKGITDGVSLGKFAVRQMRGHLDSITGLAVGGGFLFSSSFDKTINVWSLQDFTLVHTFRGPEDRIMALLCIEKDKEQPICVSGDRGGGIFIWGISNLFEHGPLRKWYEEKDWRYSGIHSLAVHGAEYLYTGSGDKSIKVWSLKDFSLFCTLTGHRSVVSSLAVCRGTLYSGSWDGTVRLWSLSDHSLLTVLGEDMLESGRSVLSLSVFDDVLAVCHENGCIKIWKNDVFKRSLHSHEGAVFASCLDGKWLFSGGWDKTVQVQEILDGSNQMDAGAVGFVSPESVITALVCWDGKLLVGCADGSVKAYYYSSQVELCCDSKSVN